MPATLDDQERDALSDERNPGQAHAKNLVQGNDTNDEATKLNNAVGRGSASSNVRAIENGINASVTKRGQAHTNQINAKATNEGGRLAGFKNKAGLLAKNKWLIGGMIGGSTLAGLLLILLLFMSALKVPNLMENITTYQFARVFQRMATQNDRTLGAKIAIAAADNEHYVKFKNSFAPEGSKTRATIERVDKMRPNKIIRNLNADGMSFNYEGRRLVSINLADKTILTPKSSFTKDLVPGYKFTNNVKVAQRFAPELSTALRAQEIGPIARGIVYSKLRKQLGISLVAWTAGKYKGMSKQEVTRAVNVDTVKATETLDTGTPVTDDLKNDAKKVADAQKAALENPAEVDEAIKNAGVFKRTQQAMAGVGESNGFKTALGWANPVYAIGVPVCIVYDGSIKKGGSNIDAKSTAEIKAYNRLSTVADQQKDGSTVDAAAIGVYASKIGNYTNSNAMKVASGQATHPTASLSAQSGPGGIFTGFDAVFGGNSAASSVANSIADGVCPVATNAWVGVGAAAANIFAIIFSGGGAGGAEEVAGQATTRVITRIAEKSVLKLGLSKARTQTGKAAKLLGDQIYTAGKSGAKIAAVTLLAKQIVANRAGAYYANGLEQGDDYVETVDCGANLTANELSRRQQYGRPLSADEVKVAMAESKSYVSQTNASKSAYQRYLAISNPNSLMTRMGSTISGTSAMTSLASLVNPNTMLATTVSNLTPSAGAATPSDVSAATCGNIQWGWTADEIALSKKSDYQMFQNQKVLDQSGKESEIASKYGKCFSDATTIGTLIENEDIVFNDDGNVTNSGDCAPSKLGPNNTDGYGDLVFRWRLAQADNADLDEKANLEEVTADSTTSTTDGAGSDFKMASFNIYYSTNESDRDYSMNQWQSRLKNSSDVIKQNQIMLAGLQEVRENQWSRIQDDDMLGGDYDIYPKNYGAGGYASQNPIVWNKQKFSLVEGKTIEGPQVTKGGYYASSNTQVRLRDNETGQELYLINTHEPVGKGDPILGRYNSAQKRAQYVKDLASDGIPIFLTGDFNSYYSAGPGDRQPTKDNNPKNTAYCILTSGTGLWDALDASNNMTGGCNTREVHIVDHVYMSDTVQATSHDYSISPHGNGSDVHNTLVVGVHIPGSGSSASATNAADLGSGNWEWPLSRNDWNGPFGYNIWGSCRVKCRHAGVDLSGTAGKTVLAAHNGTVQSAGYVILTVGACKWQVVIKATGTPYYYAYQHMGSTSVKAGDTVKAGQPIGTVDKIGPTGDCGSGAHLHFSIEKDNRASAYANGAGISCDVAQVACAKAMTTLPPLCFLDRDGRSYGSYVSADQIKGSAYCNQLLGTVTST